jgi:hypothetical protein
VCVCVCRRLYFRRKKVAFEQRKKNTQAKKNNSVYIGEKRKEKMHTEASNANDENKHESMMITCII